MPHPVPHPAVSRALLMAVGPPESDSPAGGGAGGSVLTPLWPPLLPLVDRPFLQHAVERLTALGVRLLDVVVSHDPERVERLLGDGTRWGIEIRYHLVADPARPYEILRRLFPSAESHDSLLLAHADRLPLGTVFGAATGWAFVPVAALGFVPADTDEAGLWKAVALPDTEPTPNENPLFLSARTPEELLYSQRAALSGECPELLRVGSEVEPGIVLSRNVILHPAAQIVPPVFIGEDCRIEAAAQIGPNAVIGSGCVIEVGATVAEALILAGSYVGEGLEIHRALVDRSRFFSVPHETTVLVSESYLLGDLSASAASETGVRALLSRLGAMLLLVFLWPLLVLTAVFLRLTRSGPVGRWLPVAKPSQDGTGFTSVPCLTFAAEGESPTGLRRFLLTFVPGLPMAAMGRVRLVGLPLRSPDTVAALPPDWRELYRRAPAGLLSEADLVYGPDATTDEQYSADAYYTAAGGIRYDATLFLRCLRRMGTSRRAKPAGPPASVASPHV